MIACCHNNCRGPDDQRSDTVPLGCLRRSAPLPLPLRPHFGAMICGCVGVCAAATGHACGEPRVWDATRTARGLVGRHMTGLTAAHSTCVTAWVRRDLSKRAVHRCEVCGCPGANTVHRRVNASQGGRDTLGNLLLVCGSGTTGCHGRITTNPAWARARGYTVGGTFEPCDVPLVRWSRWTGVPEVVLINDRGGATTTDRTPGLP